MESDEMTKIREVLGIRLRDGTEMRSTDPDLRAHSHIFVMYDDGVQMENDNGCTLYTWDEIETVFVS